MKKKFAKKIEKLATFSAEQSTNKCVVLLLEEPKLPKALLKKK